MSRKDRAKELFDRGKGLCTEGKYSIALPVLNEANQEAQCLAPYDLLRAKISCVLGFTLFQLKEYREAEKHYRSAVAVEEVALQPNDNDTAISLYMLGLTLQQQSKLEEAEAIGHRALEMFRVSPNRDDKHFAYALGNLGETLKHLKKFQSAETAYRESLEITERLYGRNHQDTAKTLNNLGACLIDEKRFGEATEILREAVTIKTSLNVSPESRELTLRWLLKSLNDDEKFHQAEEECLKWLRWDALPPDNPKRRGVTEQLEISLQQQCKVNELDKLKRTGRYTVQSAAPLQNVPGRSPQARAAFHGTPSVTTTPTIEHSHAIGTVPAVSQLLQSPMQGFTAARRHLEEQEEVTRQITEANVQLQQEKDQLQREKDELQQEKDQLQQEKYELQQEKDQLQGQNNQLQQEKNQWEHEKEQLCDQLAQATGPSVATDGNPRLQKRLREAEARLQEYESVLMISEEDVQITGPRLGGGSYGEVFAAVWRGMPVAVKQFYKALLEVTDHNVSLFRQEISVCSRVRHPSIVSICGAITVGGVPLRLVMELLEASLTEVMAASRSSGRYLSFREQIDLSVDCLCGMLYLHDLDPPLLHGDIRPTNILVTAMMEAKIGDLGTAHVMGGTLSCGPVSLDYLAPERMPRRDNMAIHNTKEADVCSLGVTLAEIYTGQQASRRTRQKQLSLIAHELLEDLCCDMTEDVPEDRITVSVALARVSPLKKEDKYLRCPVKRMVKGKLHDPSGPILVDKPWQ